MNDLPAWLAIPLLAVASIVGCFVLRLVWVELTGPTEKPPDE